MSASEAKTSLRIERLGRSDLPVAARLLAAAFVDDPIWTAIGPRRRSHRVRSNRVIFAGIVSASSRHGARVRVAMDRGEVVGVSIAFEPGSWPMPESAALYELRWLAAAGPLPALRGFRDDRTIRKLHPVHPLIYLWFLGVRPDRHGTGVGRALLAELHAESDACDLPTYLETGTPVNVGFYERDGYAVVGEIELPSGPRMWRMERPAA